MKPSIGRIVHFIPCWAEGLDDKPHYAAIITDVAGTTGVALTYWEPCGEQGSIGRVQQDETKQTAGTWHWPEREEE